VSGAAPPREAAVVGLGAMGTKLAARLLAQGYRVTVWNRTAARAGELAGRGARVAPTPAAAAAAAPVVIVMVSDDAALRAVTAGADGIAGAVAPGTAVVQMSTVGPQALAELAGALDGRAGLVDAPVLGSVAEAQGGALTILVGGEDAWVERVWPLLSVLGTPLHLGRPGAGTAAKLVANTVLFSVLATLAEALALAGQLGLDRDTAYRVLATTPLAEQALRRRPSIESGSYPVRFRLSLARKDADLALAASPAAGDGARIARAARSWLAAAEASGWGGHDYTAVLGYILGAKPGDPAPGS
jgi:3-hydroxyisobutyrate dehydrogenase